MTEKPERSEDGEVVVNLKDPGLSAFLAWLLPGLGHLYQGRTAKAILFFVCIMGTFVYGVYVGGRSDLGYGRAVYASWRTGDIRLPFLCQIGVGLPAFPALIQAHRVKQGQPVLWDGFMAPPRLDGENFGAKNAPTLDALNYELSSRFELATVYTMIAGLLNILAAYDAWGGPVLAERKEEDDEEEQKKRRDDKAPKDEDKPAGQDQPAQNTDVPVDVQP